MVVAERQDEYIDLPSIVTPRTLRVAAGACARCKADDGRIFDDGRRRLGDPSEGPDGRPFMQPEDEIAHATQCTCPRGCQCTINAAAVITRWELTADERAAVARGEDIFLTIWGTPIRPVHLNVGPCNWRQA